jgi:hypothetical protein
MSVVGTTVRDRHCNDEPRPGGRQFNVGFTTGRGSAAAAIRR